MLPRRFIKSLDRNRLITFLVLFFVGLAVPAVVLIGQAYSQLKWEAFHQYRGVAEELTRRIDARVDDMVRVADARSFGDYAFLVVTGDPSANFVQRSPLSAFPVEQEFPGILGHFQVDSDGRYSTPLLPPDGTPAASVGIGENEYRNRLQVAKEIQIILADNRLVQDRPDVGAPGALGSSISPGIAGAGYEEDGLHDVAEESAAETKADYSQRVFDELNQASADGRTYAQSPISLALDDELQKKAVSKELEGELRRRIDSDRYNAPTRGKRREQTALPERVASNGNELLTNVAGAASLRISTFESEVDPFEFSVLDSGHLVLFRKVWRDDTRYIQGLLVDRAAFVDSVIGRPFTDTALSDMSSLVVAHLDTVIGTFRGGSSRAYPDVAEELDGTLLYRNRLTAPLDTLELIFSIERLPPGPGGSILRWVTLAFALVLIGGFLALYRLGMSQINLARQQQDFVSAVSHELKTPLTSIRMYGEMLKEGWADEAKRQSYYEFIHEESERLSRLISNVLQLAKITRNEPQFDLKPVTIAELMSNTESRIASQIERAGFECRFRGNDDCGQATIRIDDDCFAQIVINLVDNAIKFSRDAERKVIEIASKLTADKHVMISVRDYGPGIPKDQMKKIFELFYRSESELTRETVGTGIGLAIVHQLTMAMGGKVDMVNREPGAEFRIWFPLV